MRCWSLILQVKANFNPLRENSNSRSLSVLISITHGQIVKTEQQLMIIRGGGRGGDKMAIVKQKKKGNLLKEQFSSVQREGLLPS